MVLHFPLANRKYLHARTSRSRNGLPRPCQTLSLPDTIIALTIRNAALRRPVDDRLPRLMRGGAPALDTATGKIPDFRKRQHPPHQPPRDDRFVETAGSGGGFR